VGAGIYYSHRKCPNSRLIYPTIKGDLPELGHVPMEETGETVSSESVLNTSLTWWLRTADSASRPERNPFLIMSKQSYSLIIYNAMKDQNKEHQRSYDNETKI
jgi:hypothetical protein